MSENKPEKSYNNVVSGLVTGRYTLPEYPKWAERAVFYQIYPQSFYDSNADGIGDLQGIIRKLDYIKSLGVDAIWINPFFESPFNDAGYDISDYYKVAPRYGTNDDARMLFNEAHKRGLKVLFDFVASYTSIECKWFKESCRQEKNKYSNWYIWTDGTWADVPEEQKDRFVQGYARRDGQFMRNFYWSQPALNYGYENPDPAFPWQLPIDHPDVLDMREEMKNVVRFWMELGADGFRADMAGALVKSTRFKGSSQFYTNKATGTQKFWQEVREILDRNYSDSFIVAERSHPHSAIEGGFHADFYHWFDGFNDLFQKESWRILNGRSEGHSFFDAEGKGNITRFLSGYMEQYNAVEGKGFICIPVGNHDLSRINIKRSVRELEMIFAFSITLPGMPFIYYGNEIGMRQLYDLPHVEGGYKPRAGARTPMQWKKGLNAGFSEAHPDKLYLPVDPSDDYPNAEDQDSDPDSLLNRVRKLTALRKKYKALSSHAEFVPLYAVENEYPFIYARAADEEAVLVVLNPSGQHRKAEFTCNLDIGSSKLIAGEETEISADRGKISVSVPPLTYSIYKCAIVNSTLIEIS